MSTTTPIDWEAREAQMEAEQKEKKKLYMRAYQREYMRKKRLADGVLYTRGSYVSYLDKIQKEKEIAEENKN